MNCLITWSSRPSSVPKEALGQLVRQKGAILYFSSQMCIVSGLAEKKVEEHQVSAVQDYICSNRLRAKIPIIQYIFWGAPQLEFDIGFIRTFTSSQWGGDERLAGDEKSAN